MSASTVHCHILNGNVTVVSDLEGKVTNVVCPEFSRLTFQCLLKVRDTKIVGGVASRVMDRLTGTRQVVCEFVNADDSPSAKFVGGIINKIINRE